jgi:hypothetical protein
MDGFYIISWVNRLSRENHFGQDYFGWESNIFLCSIRVFGLSIPGEEGINIVILRFD